MRLSARQDEALYAAARKAASGVCSAAIFDRYGRELNAVALPGRGHDVCVCPRTRLCVVFARRPGNFAVAFSSDTRTPPIGFTTVPDRHFYGHGVFSSDGRLLFATENDYENDRGVIGVYDAASSFKRIGEFSAFGTGPHDISILGDGRTLVIANGGIATHPDFGEGRLPLNLATMEPSLVYLDLRHGDLVERHTLSRDLHQVSLRHLDVAAGGRIAIGCQSDHAGRFDLPLIFSHRLGQDLKRIDIDPLLGGSLRGYVSSVAVDSSGEVAALTSSRGSCVLFIDVSSGKLLGHRRIPDVSGVARDGSAGSFLLTSGQGGILTAVSGAASGTEAETDWLWDNHAVRL